MLANHMSPNSVFAAFILLPTRFWPRTDRELPFLTIALLFSTEGRGGGQGLGSRESDIFLHNVFFLNYVEKWSRRSRMVRYRSEAWSSETTVDGNAQEPGWYHIRARETAQVWRDTQEIAGGHDGCF